MTTPVRSSCGHVVDSQITEFGFLFFIIYFGYTRSLFQHMGFSNCGTRALGHAGWVVVVYGLNCPMACRILVPRPGIEPGPPVLRAQSYPLDHQGSP